MRLSGASWRQPWTARRLTRSWLLAVAVAALAASPPTGAQAGGAQASGAPASGPQATAAASLSVAITRPAAATPIFGTVEVAVEVRPARTALARVAVYLDGLQVASARDPKPPYRLTIVAGEENVEHRLEVVVTAKDGRSASTTLRTPSIVVNEEITVGLEQVYVTVEDPPGRPVADLGAADFVLRDDGAVQELVTFERGDVPFTAVLLLDASASMRGSGLTAALAGVRGFSDAMGRLDEAKLVLFDDRVRQESAFTALPALLTLTLPGLSAGGGTALNDALALGALRLADRQGRRVLVLLSDGIDVESVLDVAAVAPLVERAGAALYWVRLGATAAGEAESPWLHRTSVWRDADGHRRELADLAALVDRSGGRQLPVAQPEAIGAALATLLAELRGQYVLGFYPTTKRGPGSWHTLGVEVSRRGVSVRSRRGYSEP